jgi:hypothetical protein
LAGETKVLGEKKTCPSATLSTTNPIWLNQVLNSGRRGGKPHSGCQPYAPAALYPQGRFLVLISDRGSVDPQCHSTAGSIRSTEKKSSDLIGNPTYGLPACSIVPQPTTLPRASSMYGILPKNFFFLTEFSIQL